MEQASPEAIRAYVIAALEARGASSLTCSVCRADTGWNGWAIQLSAVLVPGARDVREPDQQRRVELVCQSCGHVLSFQAGALGVRSAAL